MNSPSGRRTPTCTTPANSRSAFTSSLSRSMVSGLVISSPGSRRECAMPAKRSRMIHIRPIAIGMPAPVPAAPPV